MLFWPSFSLQVVFESMRFGIALGCSTRQIPLAAQQPP